MRFESDASGGQCRILSIEDVLNLNFSVALYENLFVLVDNLTSELQEYHSQVEQCQKEQVLGLSQSGANAGTNNQSANNLGSKKANKQD